MTDIKEFIKFHTLITKDHPEYTPFYFPLNPRSKDPLENKSWKKNRLTFEQVKQWMAKEYNIGIAATTTDRLVIMDKDDLEKVGANKPTLTSVSRKRIGQHSFYFSDDKVTTNIFDNSAKQNIATEEAGEIRANWEYVVCAGSYVPVTEAELALIPEADKINAGKYTVLNDLPVSSITFEELPDVYKECIKGKRINDLEIKLKKEKKPLQSKGDTAKSALWDLTIQDVTGKDEAGTKRFSSLFHGSDTGKNTSISKKGLLHCWRHNVSHTPLTALAVTAGLGGCGSVGIGHNGSGLSGLDLTDGEIQFKLWDYAKRNKLIPDDDPIPSKALAYFVVSEKLCLTTDIIDGWKVPTPIYNEAITKLHILGINPGRQKYVPKIREEPVEAPKEEIVFGEKICGTCLHRPGTGAGNCKNPETKIIEGKKKVSKYTTDVFPACDKYLEKPKKIKEVKEKIKPDISQALAAGMGAYHGNLELAEEFQKISPIYYDSSKNYWLWMQQEGYYKRIDETDILSAIRQRTGAYIVDSKLAAEILRGIQVTGRERHVKDVPTTWIHTHSGIIDYVTGAAIKASPEYFLTRPIPHKIGVCDSIPTVAKLFKDWVGDQDIILYEWLAYTLITDYPMHRMMILFGSGRNGKGEYADLLTRFVGGENTVATDLEKLMESRFETSKLYRKKLAIIDETDFDVIKNTARVKAISGHSRIGGEFKGKDGFDFYNNAKITILSNNLPESQDKTEAFYGRCIIQEFKNKFDEGKSVTVLIPEIEYENLLYKCIKMLPDLMAKGKFTNEGTIEQKTVKYEHMSNPFPSFLKKELVEEVNGELPIWVVRDLYEVFCTKNGFRKISDKEFTRLLKTEGYTIKRTWWGKNYWNTVFGFNTKPPYIFIEKTEKENLENKPDEPDKPLYPTQEHMGKEDGLGCLSGSSGSTPEQTVTESNTKETANQVRKLPELLCTARQKYEKEKGVVNGNTLTNFCLWVCEHYHPQWQNGTETGYYQPSGIKGIASKIFGLTPEPSGGN